MTFGNTMRTSFGVPDAPVLEARDLTFGPLAVMELRCDRPHYGRSAPVPAQDALLVSLQLRENTSHRIWEDGRPRPPMPVAAGSFCVYDLRGGLIAQSALPFHAVNFNLPLSPLEEAGEERRLPGDGLDGRPRQGLVDPVIAALGSALLPALARPERADRLFVDHVLFAMRAHVAAWLGARAPRAPRPGGLAPWQERRAQELIRGHLAENLALADLARACDLSVAHFARAFKRSMGMPPYRFVLMLRIARAKRLLRKTQLPLADVATSCGFADQSHFTRAFHRVVGQSPGGFRRAR
jgi:AraC-like DNA-binding protein